MEQDKLNEILRKHKLYINNEDGGKRANLYEADLRGADLHGADLDFSCWPLWCGSFDVKLDAEQQKQLLYHLLRTEGPLTEELRKRNADLVNDAELLRRHDLPTISTDKKEDKYMIPIGTVVRLKKSEYPQNLNVLGVVVKHSAHLGGTVVVRWIGTIIRYQVNSITRTCTEGSRPELFALTYVNSDNLYSFETTNNF